MKIKYSIVIPAFNEESTILEIISLVKKNIYPGKSEIIVIDDGSKDNTSKIVKKIKGVKLLKNNKNMGKGYSVMRGFKVARGDYLIIQDADLEYHPKDHIKLINTIEKENLDVLYGSRFMNRSIKHRYQLFYLGNKFLSFLTSILYKKKITDIATCYKVFRKKVVSDLDIYSHGFGIEAEITCKLLNRGIEIKEIPISYNSRSYSEGKKITVIDGMKWVHIILKHRYLK